MKHSALATVRVRLTLGVVLILTMALVAGALTVTTVVRRSLERGIESSLRSRAQDLRSILINGTPPTSLTITDQEDVFVQLIDDSNTVVAATPNVLKVPLVHRLSPGHARTVAGLPGESTDHFLVFARRVNLPNGRLEVIVGRNLDTVEEATTVLRRTLSAGAFLLVLALGTGTWVVVRRALRPVEWIRSEVAGISPSELSRRVSEPRGDDEISRLARTMNNMLWRLEESQKRERRFVSDAAHELRSPIATIRQHAELAVTYGPRVTSDELASDVLEESTRLENLTEDLLVLARLSEQPLSSSAKTIDLDDIVLEEVTRVRARTNKSIDASRVSGARVQGDLRHLQRLVRNLADNAIRHAGSKVSFSLVEHGTSAVLTVEDDGPGVPAESRNAIFQRFSRLDDARRHDVGGAGLGLAIAADIVTVHGGTIESMESVLGGARFEVHIPRSLQ